METGSLLHRLGSFVIGLLLLITLVLLFTHGYTNADSTAAGTDLSSNPNFVTGAFTAVSSVSDNVMANASRNFAQIARLTRHSMIIAGGAVVRAPRPVVRDTVGFAAYGLRTNLDVASWSARAVGSGLDIGASFVGRNLIGGAMLTASGASHTVGFIASAVTMTPLTKPVDKTRTPVIQPLEATNTAFQAAGKTIQTTPVSAAQLASAPAPAVATPPAALIHNTNSVTSLSDAESNDLYAWGNCTYWVYVRRFQIDDQIPNSWGNATDWAYNARADGYLVDHHPTPGSIMQISGVDYGLGHVAFVESVDPDGTWHISEMNVEGLDVIDNRAMPAADAANYYFIHDAQ